MFWTIMGWVGIFFAGCLAVYVLFAGAAYLLSPHVRCLVKTGHNNSEALGSQMWTDGPRYVYRCRDCGHVWTETW